MNQQTKSEKFLSILKSFGYDLKPFSHSSFDYLFELPETKEFFDWFLSNVNENWVLSKDQLFEFENKKAKGQVIWDLNKLEDLKNLINLKAEKKISDQTAFFKEDYQNLNLDDQTTDLIDEQETIESIKQENELIEKEIEFYSHQLNSRKKQRLLLNEELNILKAEQNRLDNSENKCDIKSNYMKNMLETTSQNVRKSILEYQRLNDSDNKMKLSQKIAKNLNEIETCVQTYIHKEKFFLKEVSDSNFIRFDLNELESASKTLKKISENTDFENFQLAENQLELPNESLKEELNRMRIEYENNEKIIKLMRKYYREQMKQWFTSKLEFEVSQVDLLEMNRIIENKAEFFMFTEQQLQDDPSFTYQIEQKIKENDTKSKIFQEQSEILSEQIDELSDYLANLKMLKIIQYDSEKKQMELNLFLTKQEKILNTLQIQNKRLKYFESLEHSKLKDLDSLKQMIEDLIKTKSLFTSAGSNLLNSTTSAESNLCFPATNQNNTFYNNVSLSMSTANLLSSTTNSNTNYLPSNFNTSLILSPNRINHFGSMSRIKENQKLAHYSSLSGFNSANPFADTRFLTTKNQNKLNEPEFMHVLNRFLISILTNLQSSQHYVRLNKPISISFNDNLSNFIQVYESVHEKYLQMSLNNVHEKKRLFNVIEKAVAYLYEEDQNTNNQHHKKSSFSLIQKYDLSRICVSMAKFLQEPLSNLRAKRDDLEEKFVLNIHNKIVEGKRILASNELENLKRNFFIQFYANPSEVEKIVEHLNSID